MFHKLQDGDIIKILPFVEKNGKVKWTREYDVIYIPTKQHLIYDNTGYLRKMIVKRHQKEMKSGLINTYALIPHKRYLFNGYINGEIKIISASKSLLKIITDEDLLNIKGDHHLFIKLKYIESFPSYENSYVSLHKWIPPITDIESAEEWTSWIIQNQPDILSFIDKFSVLNMRKYLIKIFGGDYLTEILAEERNQKIEGIIS